MGTEKVLQIFGHISLWNIPPWLRELEFQYEAHKWLLIGLLFVLNFRGLNKEGVDVFDNFLLNGGENNIGYCFLKTWQYNFVV